MVPPHHESHHGHHRFYRDRSYGFPWYLYYEAPVYEVPVYKTGSHSIIGGIVALTAIILTIILVLFVMLRR